MNAVTLLEIPYRENALDYLEGLLEEPFPILFDSGRPSSKTGRYDIFSSTPLYTLSYSQGHLQHSLRGMESSETDLLSCLNKELADILLPPQQLPETKLPFYGGLAGYLSYDFGRCWERLPVKARRDIDLPEFLMAYYPWSGILDHEQKTAYLSFLPNCPKALQSRIREVLDNSCTTSQNKNKKFKIINKLECISNAKSYFGKIAKIQDYISAGDCYQVNLSQRFSGLYEGQPWVAYRYARQSMAAGFGAYFQIDNNSSSHNDAILSFSPERFIELKEGKVLTQPIKGTSKRDLKDPEQDQQIAQHLLASEKNRAENLMIVDLLRNDLGKCCQYGSVKTEKLFELQSVSNVHHLVSTVSGQLSKGKTAFDLLCAVIPGGSITGAPKIRAMEIIEELESSRRAIYCGNLAYINVNGDMDSNIAIRTALCLAGSIHCWGGGGVVDDSRAEEEYAESLVKIAPLLEAINGIK